MCSSKATHITALPEDTRVSALLFSPQRRATHISWWPALETSKDATTYPEKQDLQKGCLYLSFQLQKTPGGIMLTSYIK